MDEFDRIDPKVPGDRLIAEARERGDAFQEYPTESIAMQVFAYVEQQLTQRELMVDRSGSTITLS